MGAKFVKIGFVAIMVNLAACSHDKGTHRGVVVLDRKNVRRLYGEWATSRVKLESSSGDPLGNLLLPLDLTIGIGDSVYVADGRANYIVVYDPDGQQVRTVGRLGQGPGEFERLRSIVVDEQSRI